MLRRCSIVAAAVAVLGCIQAPPAIGPEYAPLDTPPDKRPGQAESAATPGKGEAAPGPQDPDSARLEQMMAEPDCVVEVVELLKSARGFWTDTKKYTCTYEVVINGQRYKYTRQIPRDRRSTTAEICERGLKTTDSAVRAATRECKDLTAADRPITGLVPIR